MDGLDEMRDWAESQRNRCAVLLHLLDFGQEHLAMTILEDIVEASIDAAEEWCKEEIWDGGSSDAPTDT